MELTVAIHCGVHLDVWSVMKPVVADAYYLEEMSFEELEEGGLVIYREFVKSDGCNSPGSILKCWWKEGEESEEEENHEPELDGVATDAN